MPNMSSVIKQHDQKVLSSSQTKEKHQCNFRNPANCPLDGKCLTKNIVYKAVVSTIVDSHTYYGSSEDFKFRYNNPTKAFRHHYYKNDTDLFKCIWDLKNTGTHYNIAWSVAAYTSSAYRCGTRRYDLYIRKSTS